ncbi:hypothetical protein ACH5AO_17270 [Streptomyces sp. NPDC018964]|uniref:hypothetical protein n=1 Tax=unclassified Streptomyces TaxID=2593676 RepID=UPI0037AD814C
MSLSGALAERTGRSACRTRHGGARPPRLGTRHAAVAPYGTHRAADGREVLFSVRNERERAAPVRGVPRQAGADR